MMLTIVIVGGMLLYVCLGVQHGIVSKASEVASSYVVGVDK